MFGTFFKQVSTLVVSVILARLLTPEEFGLVAMALVFVSLSQVFVDVGFTQGLIQSEENSQLAYSSVFYVTIGLGFLMGLIVFLASPYVGDFFANADMESDKIAEISRWFSLMPIVSAFGSVHNAIFMRDLNFKVLAFRTISANLLGGIAGIIFALLDYGVFALVAQQLIATFVFTSILWWKSNWKPSFEFSFKEIKDLMNFSGYVFLDNVLRRVFTKIDTLFIGKYFSAETLGFYSRAESLNHQVNQYTTSSLAAVLFPAFSKLQNDNKLFESSFFKVYNISIFLGALFTGSLFFLSEEIIINLLGEKWRPSVLIFQILVFRIIISPFGALIGKSLLAKGFSKQAFQISQIRRVFLLTPLYFGYIYGIYAFTVALVFAHFLGFLLSIWSSHKYLNISFKTQMLSFIIPLIPLILMIGLYYYLKLDLNPYILFSMFLILQLLYTYTTKNSGLQLTINLVISILVKKEK